MYVGLGINMHNDFYFPNHASYYHTLRQDNKYTYSTYRPPYRLVLGITSILNPLQS